MIVLDTNVLSEAMKSSPDPLVARWLASEQGSGLFTTAVSEAEILYGIAVLPNGQRRRVLEAAARATFALFAGRILPFDSAAACEFASIVSDRRRLGRPINDFDAQIVAIARTHAMTLATRDVHDFDATGVPIVNPWRP